MNGSDIYSPKIKICGIFRDEDIKAINETKPDYCGFVLDFPKSHRSISPKLAYELRRGLSDGIQAVGVFVNKPFTEVADYLRNGIFDIAQLHGDEDETYIDVLKAEVPDKEIWKTFKIDPDAEEKKAAKIVRDAEGSLADMIVLDAGFGGGVPFDHALIERVRRPYILAGGISNENVTGILKRLKPYGIDISSGVETSGFKDKEKMEKIISVARKGNF